MDKKRSQYNIINKNVLGKKIKKLFVASNINKFLVNMLIIVTTLNVVFTYVNIKKYFFEPQKNPHNTNLSHYRENDLINVALAARPYDQISDYFSSKKNLDNGYQIIKDGEIVPPKDNYPKTLGHMKHIRIGYTDWNNSRARQLSRIHRQEMWMYSGMTSKMTASISPCCMYTMVV